MGMLTQIAAQSRDLAVITKDSSGVPASGWLPTLGSTPSITGLSISQATAITVSPVWRAVTQQAKDFARCKPRLLKVDAPRTDKAARNKEHPVARLLANPNWIQTWFEFAYQMRAAELLRGNAYAAILRDNKGIPTALIPINPDAVTVLEAIDGSIFYNVNRFGLFQLAALRQFPVSIPEDDILHFRGLTFNMLVAVSTIGVARESIGVAMGLEQQAARFMANGARPSGVLQTDKLLSDVASKRLRDQWEALRAGIQNIGRTAILEEGLKWSPMQLTSVDLEFMAQRKYSVEEASRFFNHPPHKLGADIPRGVKISELDQAYVNDVIMPACDAWEQRFDKVFDLADEELTVDFDERRLLRADEATRINNQRLKVLSGLATQNECRAEEGQPPMDGGDVLLHPVNLAASGSDMTGTAPDGAGHPEGGKLPAPGTPNKTPKDETQ